ncbi:hypothetical protein C8T65DRAFT_217570 [Cerioporus squamosus]|nr:hypothetical protein C8T65DRAFT_217570 [Cerioporus squamosus]
MVDPSMPMWFYEGSAAPWTPDEVPRASLHEPVGRFYTAPPPETTEYVAFQYRPGIWGTTVHENQTPLHHYALGFHRRLYEQHIPSNTDRVATSASIHDCVPVSLVFPPPCATPPLSPTSIVGQRPPEHVAQSSLHDDYPHSRPRDAQSPTAVAGPRPAMNNYGHPAGDVISPNTSYPTIFSQTDFGSSTSANSSATTTSTFDSAETPSSAAVPMLPFPAAPTSTTTNRFGSGYQTLNPYGGEGDRAGESCSPPSTKTRNPWSSFWSHDATSSFIDTLPSSIASIPQAGHRKRRGHGSVQEIAQHDYGKPYIRRISYGPNGISLERVLRRGILYGDSDRLAFEGVEMNQKMTVRYQFKQFKVHKPQVNVLSCSPRKTKQPTYDRLALIAAREMQRFMDKNKDFKYKFEDLVLLHIDLATKGCLQPRIASCLEGQLDKFSPIVSQFFFPKVFSWWSSRVSDGYRVPQVQSS